MKDFYVTQGLHYAHKLTEQPTYGETSLHAHAQYEILHFISGNAELRLEGERILLFPDALLLIPKGAIHRICPITPAPFRRSVINFTELPTGVSETLFARPRVLDITGERRIKEALERLRDYSEYFSGEDKKRALSVSVTELLLLLQKGAPLEHSPAQYGHFMEQALEYIEKHITEIGDIEALCRALHVSRAYLYREFEGALGLSPKRYINQKRLLMAKELLLLGEDATRVALRCGWRDYSAFYRAYREHFGYSPQETKNEEPRFLP